MEHVGRFVLSFLLLAPAAALRAADHTAAAEIDRATLDQWSAPYRGWHYWPNHVIPSRPNIPGHEKFENTDVPCVYQLPGQSDQSRRDLNVAKQAADEARQVAEDANRAKSDFLARMSHEIRTPMNAILGYTDVLRRGFDDNIQDRQEYLTTIHASGEHLLTLINDILDLSKIESGRLELDLGRHSPHKLISQVVTLLRSKADEKGITLDFECVGRLPETIMPCEPMAAHDLRGAV